MPGHGVMVRRGVPLLSSLLPIPPKAPAVPAAPTTLLLLRHGATEANERVPYILQGDGIDGPLSDAGRAQAAAAGAFLKDVPLTAVYGTGLVRSDQTAAAVAAPHDLEVRRADGLREVNVGDWEGMNWPDIAAKYPEAHAAFRANPGAVPYLNGESYAAVAARAVPALLGLMGRHAGETFAVVAHNVVNRAALATWLGLPLDRACELRQSNGCVNVLTTDPADPAAGVRVEGVNHNRHVPGAWPVRG